MRVVVVGATGATGSQLLSQGWPSGTRSPRWCGTPANLAIDVPHLMPIVRRIYRNVYADLAAIEDVVRDSGLDWTVVPPPYLRNGAYRASTAGNLPGGRSIRQADLAAAMLDTLDRPETTTRAFGWRAAGKLAGTSPAPLNRLRS